MTRTPLRALAGALLAAAVTGSLLSAALSSPADAAAPARPEVGDCHSLTLAEWNEISDPDPRISCERKHTSRTVAVKTVSAASFRNDDTLLKAAVRVCTPAIGRAIGGSERNQKLSAYDAGYFAPTKAQIKAGARWIRCDVVLLGGRRLLALPTDSEPALGAAPHPSSVARCLDLGTRYYYPTACSEKHNYRAKGTVKVAGKAYPSRKRFLAISEQRCPRVARTSDWYSTWPGEIGWKLGKERHLVCYARNKD